MYNICKYIIFSSNININFFHNWYNKYKYIQILLLLIECNDYIYITGQYNTIFFIIVIINVFREERILVYCILSNDA